LSLLALWLLAITSSILLDNFAGTLVVIVVVEEEVVVVRAVNQLIDYQLIAILIDYFNYQFNYLKPTSISISISSCHWRPIELSTN
jgi:hypothetical protein